MRRSTGDMIRKVASSINNVWDGDGGTQIYAGTVKIDEGDSLVQLC
jgi:hypothetical protein